MARADAGRPQQVPVGHGRRLAATEWGSGEPVVVFEAGMGSGQHSWDLVAPAVAARTRAVTYDRAGLGGSAPDPEPRTLARAAEDLVALLRHVGGGPAVLVAHSYGGPIVREALAAEPDLVAALVLVDQTDEGCDLYFTPEMARQERVFGAALPWMARLGLARLVCRRLARGLPAETVDGIVAESASVAAARAHQGELAGCGADLRRLRAHPHPATGVPVTLISGARPPRGKAAAARRDGLVAAHRRRADALAHGRHVRAERSDHYVMFTEPELVVAEVLRILDDLDLLDGLEAGR